MNITAEWLKSHAACLRGVQFFERNGLENFPADRVDEIIGDHLGWVHFIKTALEVDASKEFDSRGNLVKYTSEDGTTYQMRYNNKNQVISEKSSEGSFIEFTYYDDGKLCTRLRNGLIESYLYNEQGLVRECKNPSWTMQYEYNEQGKMTKRIHGKRITEFTYDANGNQTSRITSDGTSMIKEYDERGNCTYMLRNNNDWYRQTFDEKNNMLTYMDASGFKEHYKYDERGNMTESHRDDIEHIYYDYEYYQDQLIQVSRNGEPVLTIPVIADLK